MLINFKRLVMERKRFPDKIPNPRCEPHETDTALQDWFKNELEKALASNSYAFVEMLENFTNIDPGFLFRIRFACSSHARLAVGILPGLALSIAPIAGLAVSSACCTPLFEANLSML